MNERDAMQEAAGGIINCRPDIGLAILLKAVACIDPAALDAGIPGCRSEIVRQRQAANAVECAKPVAVRRAENEAWFRAEVDKPGADRPRLARLLRLRELHIVLTEEIDGPDREVDLALFRLITPNVEPHEAHFLTYRIEAARAFVDVMLPGFWVSSGLCALTGHASLGPDYNGPHGERLRREWPLDTTPDDWSEDLAPGDGTHREAIAIMACAIRA